MLADPTPLVRPSDSYLAVQEFEISIALLLGFSCLFLNNRFLFLGLPLRVVVIPVVVIVLIVVAVAGEVGVVTEGLVAVCNKLVQLLIGASQDTYF